MPSDANKKPTATAEPKAEDGAKSASPALSAPINQRLSKDDKIDLFRTMMRIRRFEERALRAYQGKKIGGFLHLYIGQEAVAVGCCSLMGKNDHVITAYRDHGHAIAVGMGLNELMAELYGKATGCSKGKGGSMHFFAPDRNYWGGHGIVGGQIPLGTGLAYALKYKGLKGAAMVTVAPYKQVFDIKPLRRNFAALGGGFQLPPMSHCATQRW